MFLHEFGRDVGILVAVDADHFETTRLVGIVELSDVRQLLHARYAPAGPDIHQNDFALVGGPVERLAGQGRAV